MKKLLDKRNLGTQKESYSKLYIQGKYLYKANFKIGQTLSYEINQEDKTIRIVPDQTLSRKVTVSPKKNGTIPVIDIKNQDVSRFFGNIKRASVWIYEDEIIVTPFLDELSEVEPYTFFDTLKKATKAGVNYISNRLFSLKAFQEKKKVLVLNRKKLTTYLKANQKTADGMTLSDLGYTFAEDEVTQAYLETDACQSDMESLTDTLQLMSLFSGLGAFEEALKQLNVTQDIVNYCEFKPHIAKSYSLVHGVEEEKNLGDIRKVDETTLPDFDLLTFGFPCQDISGLGNQIGAFNADGSLSRSGLVYEGLRIAKHKKPKYMVIENVRDLVSKKFKPFFEDILSILDMIGYNTYWEKMNSKDYGVPHSRTRVFIVCIRKDIDDGKFKFPKKEPLLCHASEWYDEGTFSDDYYLDDDHLHYINEARLAKKYSSLNSAILICMTTKQGRPRNPQNFIRDTKGVRMLTEREFLRFQGFNSDYAEILTKAGITVKQIGEMMGNSITVQVVKKIFQRLIPLNYRLKLTKSH